jgi:hypothetical protein
MRSVFYKQIAVKYALVSFISTALYVGLDIERGYWMVIASMITMQSITRASSVQSSVNAGVRLIFATLLGGLLGLIGHAFIADVYYDHQLILIPIVLSFFVYFTAHLQYRFFDGDMLMIMTLVVVMLFGMDQWSATHVTVLRVLLFLGGAFVTIVVNLLLYPIFDVHRIESTQKQLMADLQHYFSKVGMRAKLKNQVTEDFIVLIKLINAQGEAVQDKKLLILLEKLNALFIQLHAIQKLFKQLDREKELSFIINCRTLDCWIINQLGYIRDYKIKKPIAYPEEAIALLRANASKKMQQANHNGPERPWRIVKASAIYGDLVDVLSAFKEIPKE